jgi:hypothetical protein
VLADLGGRIDLIVDGGATPVGIESTIIACLGEPVLLRPGGLTRAAIERTLGHKLAYTLSAIPRAGLTRRRNIDGFADALCPLSEVLPPRRHVAGVAESGPEPDIAPALIQNDMARYHCQSSTARS